MKTLFLKNAVPAVVAVLAVTGAFATMSMQSKSTSLPEYGWTLNSAGECNIRVDCDTSGSQACRVNGDTGPQAFGKNEQEKCTEILYKPNPEH